MAGLPIRTLRLSPHPNEPSSEGVVVSVGRLGGNQEQVVLIHNSAAEGEEPFYEVWTELSVLATEDAFPGFAMDGREMIWVKDYSENKGIKEDLLNAGWIIPVGRTMKQGFVTLPLMLINLHESEFAQQCASCSQWEHPTPQPPPAPASAAATTSAPAPASSESTVAAAEKRFGKCSKCKSRYYCSKEHQIKDWAAHRPYCKLLVERNRYEVVNLHRRTIQAWLGERGIEEHRAT